MRMEFENVKSDFLKIADIAGVQLTEEAIVIEILKNPHQPTSLSKDAMAVYVFQYGNKFLKIGKTGPKSNARYLSQHYNPRSSQSNLAKSLLKNPDLLGIDGLTEDNIGEWIKKNTVRINFILKKDLGIAVLNLLEAFLQCKLSPLFEGFANQKEI